jgi:hypothetical protein
VAHCVGIFYPPARFKGEDVMGSAIIYGAISLVICVAYFLAVDHFLMDSQGLDFWYLFRK